MTTTLTSPGEKALAACAAGTLRLFALDAPGAGSPAPSSAPPAPVPALRCACARARVGPRSVHGHPLLGRTRRQSHDDTWRKDKGKEEESEAVGKHDERPEVVVAVLDSHEINGAPRPRDRVLLGETIGQQPRVR
jgi:hypothetical protein